MGLRARRTFVAVLLCGQAFLLGATPTWGNGQEEGDEGHFQEPVILQVENTHDGSVGDFSESFYAFTATAVAHRISVVGKPGVKWRLYAEADFKAGLRKWCKEERTGEEFRTACIVDGLTKGNRYYLNVYSFSPGLTKYRIEIGAP